MTRATRQTWGIALFRLVRPLFARRTLFLARLGHGETGRTYADAFFLFGPSGGDEMLAVCAGGGVSVLPTFAAFFAFRMTIAQADAVD